MNAPPDEEMIKEMSEICEDEFGAAISANQVGLNLKFFVLGGEPYTNPRITKRSGSSTKKEGCLSLPGIKVPIKRNTKITLVYLDKDSTIQKEVYKGTMARVIQHEVDHLNGKTMLDRINKYKAKHLRQILIKNKG